MSNRAPYVAGLPLSLQGKVRDTYPVPGHPDLLLIVATDAISTHNVSHMSLVPGKGQILTAQSLFFATQVFPHIPTHIVAFGRKIYDYLPKTTSYPDDLHLRAMVVEKLNMAPYEFIFRTRMAGSLWSRFYSKGLPNPYGIVLPEGMQFMQEFDSPVFTPTDKSAIDDPVKSAEVEEQYPDLVELTRHIYRLGRGFALERGIDIIDSKKEAGIDKNGNPLLGDEWLNGDCCRFVWTKDIKIGVEPPWADKEIFRLEAVRQWGGKKLGPPVIFPPEVINKGQDAYQSVLEQLSGQPLSQIQKEMLS